MRVIHLLRKLDPEAWGGTEMAIHRLFEGLRAQGVTPVVYCPRVGNATSGDPLATDGFEVHRFKAFVPVWGMNAERKRQLVAVGGNLMSFDLVASLWREKNPALIHSHALGRIGGIALTVAKQRKLPFVVTIHGGVLDLPERVKESFNAPVDKGWEWGKVFGVLFRSHRLFVDADAILTCNEREAQLLREQLPHKRIVVQRHGVPVEVYEKDQRQAAVRAWPQLAGKKVLLSLGRIDPIKNQTWLLEQAPAVFARHPNAVLALAGACTDEPYGRRVEEMISKAGLEQRVIRTGGLPPNDPRLVGLLQLANVLLLPSLSETFGLVILEAWAAGTATIASRTTGASALIEHGENGWLYDLQAPQVFHEAIDSALANVQRTREMAARGQQKVKTGYSIDALAGNLHRLYRELIEEKHALRDPARRRYECAHAA